MQKISISKRRIGVAAVPIDQDAAREWLRVSFSNPSCAGSSLDVQFFHEINGKIIPRLDYSSVVSKVASVCSDQLNSESLNVLKKTTDEYYFGRWAVVTGTRNSDLKHKLKKISEASRQLLDAIEIYQHSCTIAWRSHRTRYIEARRCLSRCFGAGNEHQNHHPLA